MDPDQPKVTRGETVAVLAGLAALALPSAAGAQKFSPNIAPPTFRPPSVSPSPSPRFDPFPRSGGDQSSESAGGQQPAARRSVGDTLRSFARLARPQALELADGGLLLVEGGQPFRLDVAGAPNGRHDLSLSGAINVQGGRAAGVSGQPGTVMAPVGVA